MEPRAGCHGGDQRQAEEEEDGRREENRHPAEVLGQGPGDEGGGTNAFRLSPYPVAANPP